MDINKIENIEQFIELVKRNDTAKYIIQNFLWDEGTAVDLLEMVLEFKIPRERIFEFLGNPKLSAHINSIKKSGPEKLSVISEAAKKLLPYDNKEQTIYHIFLNMALEYRDKFLGPHPTKEKFEQFFEELENFSKTEGK
jgi:hypothetical protein